MTFNSRNRYLPLPHGSPRPLRLQVLTITEFILKFNRMPNAGNHESRWPPNVRIIKDCITAVFDHDEVESARLTQEEAELEAALTPCSSSSSSSSE